MKKISMFMMALAMVMMVACGGKKAETTEGEMTEPVATETPATEVAPAEGSALDQYLSLVDEMVPLYEKVAAGDAEATQKMAELEQKVQNLAEIGRAHV